MSLELPHNVKLQVFQSGQRDALLGYSPRFVQHPGELIRNFGAEDPFHTELEVHLRGEAYLAGYQSQL